MTGDAGSNRALRWNTASVGKYGDILLVIHCNGNRLAQLPGRFAATFPYTADYRVEHIEADIIRGSRNSRFQPNTLFLHCLGYGSLSLSCQLHGLVEAVGTDIGCIIVALQKLVPPWNAFLFPAVYDLLYERQRFAGVFQQSPFRIPRHSLGRVSFAMKIGVFFQYHYSVRIVFRKHVRAGPDGIPIEV